MSLMWRVIPSFPNYEASSEGEIRRITAACGTQAGKILRLQHGAVGYLIIGLCRDKRQRYGSVHRHIAEAFLGPCPKGLTVNHKDFNKRNNRPENLEYVSKSENTRHWRDNGRMSPKITRESIPQILADERSQSEIARHYGVTPSLICRIKSRELWGDISV